MFHYVIKVISYNRSSSVEKFKFIRLLHGTWPFVKNRAIILTSSYFEDMRSN